MTIKEILPTVNAVTDAYNYICQIGWNDNDHNSISLHNKTYQYCRQTLPAQLAVSTRMKASESLKSVKSIVKKGSKTSCPKSKQVSIRLDANSYNIWFNRNQISILTIDGRKKFNFSVPVYFNKYLDWKRKSAELFIRKNKVFLNIVFNKETDDIKSTDNIIGVDRGIKRIAVTSNRKFFGGSVLKQRVLKTKKIRKVLQSTNSKSSKRHLRKISKKENRFRTDTNHCIAKKIVYSVPEGTTIVLENLKNIRDNSKKFRKEQKYWINNWSFFQLEQFIKYKAEDHRCIIDYVDARYTSQKCSKCGHIERANRKNQTIFKCKQCNYSLNADYNASLNIKFNYQNAICHSDRVSVNKPIMSNFSNEV